MRWIETCDVDNFTFISFGRWSFKIKILSVILSELNQSMFGSYNVFLTGVARLEYMFGMSLKPWRRQRGAEC